MNNYSAGFLFILFYCFYYCFTYRFYGCYRSELLKTGSYLDLLNKLIKINLNHSHNIIKRSCLRESPHWLMDSLSKIGRFTLFVKDISLKRLPSFQATQENRTECPFGCISISSIYWLNNVIVTTFSSFKATYFIILPFLYGILVIYLPSETCIRS